MSGSSVQEIYNRLFAGEKLTLQFESKTQFETLRTALCKKNTFSVALDMTSASLIGRWDSERVRGTFWLGESASKANQNKWQIIENQAPENP
jgi:hypothetical protein